MSGGREGLFASNMPDVIKNIDKNDPLYNVKKELRGLWTQDDMTEAGRTIMLNEINRISKMDTSLQKEQYQELVDKALDHDPGSPKNHPQ